MKKIVLLLLSVLAFNYGQCQQTENVASSKTEKSVDVQPLTNSNIEMALKTTAMTFEPEMTAATVAPKVETATAPKASFKERMMTKYLNRQIKKSESNTANPKAGDTNKVALIGGIAGIVSVVTIFLSSLAGIGALFAIAAIIMGFVGKSQIQDGKGTGKGWAITGIVGGILYFFLLLLAVVFIASLLNGLGK